MKTNVIVHQTALTNGNVNSLREGGSVYVRVLKSLGNNSYKVAFAGRMLEINSDLSLKEGTAFLAKVKFSNQQIILQQLENHSQIENRLLKISGNAQSEILSNPQFIEYFKKLGLKPDEINLAMFNQMRELGLSFSKEQFNRIRILAERFKDKEAQAAQIAMILEQKGLSSDFESVWAILDEDFNSSLFASSSGLKEGDNNPFKNFIEEILSGFATKDNKPGLLTLFNHLGFKFDKGRSFGSWIKIPFEFSYDKDGVKKYGTGNLSAFLENEKKSVKKCQISFNFSITKYYFVLYYHRKRCNKIAIAFPEQKSFAEKDFFINSLKEMFPQVEICSLSQDECFEFNADQDEILSFRGMA